MPDLPAAILNDLVLAHRETSFQASVQANSFPPARRPSIERFPYYTAFPFGWYAAGYSADLAVGEVQPRHLLARDLVLWRGTDGAPAVLDAHCPHRGANMALGGSVRGCDVVCPYHWFSWDREGANVSIPHGDTPRDDLAARSYPTIETGGFILFWYHPEPEQPPLWDIPDLSEFTGAGWTDPVEYSVDYRCPWQEVAENYPDNLHLRIVHGASFVPTVTSLAFDGPFQTLDAGYQMSYEGETIDCRMRTEAYGPGLSVMRSSNIVEAVFFLATTPTDWETTTSRMSYRIGRVGQGPEARATEKQILAALLAESSKQWAEDAAIFDNKIHIEDLGSGPENDAARRYRAWAQQFYVAGDPVAASRKRT